MSRRIRALFTLLTKGWEKGLLTHYLNAPINITPLVRLCCVLESAGIHLATKQCNGTQVRTAQSSHSAWTLTSDQFAVRIITHGIVKLRLGRFTKLICVTVTAQVEVWHIYNDFLKTNQFETKMWTWWRLLSPLILLYFVTFLVACLSLYCF